jgi:hypothetical protein
MFPDFVRARIVFARDAFHAIDRDWPPVAGEL